MSQNIKVALPTANYATCKNKACQLLLLNFCFALKGLPFLTKILHHISMKPILTIFLSIDIYISKIKSISSMVKNCHTLV